MPVVTGDRPRRPCDSSETAGAAGDSGDDGARGAKEWQGLSDPSRIAHSR